ncbi:MAG: NfeD family protein [Phycisphaerales bacterium]|nr:NfeD family protein [Phycisphaerales bacterium]
MWDALFESPAIWFTVPALVGTGLFGLKLLLMLMGSSLDTDFGDAHGADFSGDHHSAADAGFKLLSIQGVLAFLMGFGWAGLAALSGTKWSMPLISGVAVAGGLAMMYFMAILMASVFKLQASGNIAIEAAVGAEGMVYVTIPAGSKGQGQVSLVVDDRQRIYSAVSEGEELPRNARIRVVGVSGQNTLRVIPA